MELLIGDVVIECLNTGPSTGNSLGEITFLGKVHGVWHVQFGLVGDVAADNFGFWRSLAYHFRRECGLVVSFLTPGVLITSCNLRADFSISYGRHACLESSSNGD